MAEDITLRIFRGDNQSGQMVDYRVPVAPGMVVLDAIHEVQARHASDLAVRWNCKAGRVQEFRKCIECFLCQDVCHVVRDHDRKEEFCGPRFLVRVAGLEMHPLDAADRVPLLKKELGVGYCNITKCCTEVCPESIHITDNAIIPLKERVVDRYYDPIKRLLQIVSPPKK